MGKGVVIEFTGNMIKIVFEKCINTRREYNIIAYCR